MQSHQFHSEQNAISLEPIEANSSPLFLVEETPKYYLVAIDIPSLPAGEVCIREQKKELFVEGIPCGSFLQKKTYFQFHSESRMCQTVYKDGFLWLVMPKYFVNEKAVQLHVEVAS